MLVNFSHKKPCYTGWSPASECAFLQFHDKVHKWSCFFPHVGVVSFASLIANLLDGATSIPFTTIFQRRKAVIPRPEKVVELRRAIRLCSDDPVLKRQLRRKERAAMARWYTCQFLVSGGVTAARRNDNFCQVPFLSCAGIQSTDRSDWNKNVATH